MSLTIDGDRFGASLHWHLLVNADRVFVPGRNRRRWPPDQGRFAVVTEGGSREITNQGREGR
jgi:hypothetical protein